MRADQLLRLLHRLRLKPASKRAAEALGLSVRQLQRLTAGTAPVPKPVALLAIAYSKLEYVPDPLWNLDADRTDAIEEVSRRAHATLKYQAIASAPPLPSPAVAPESTLVVSRGAPLPTAPKIEAAPEPAVVQAPEPQREPPKTEPAPEPPPIQSTTRRPVGPSPELIKRIADRAEGKPVATDLPAPEPEPPAQKRSSKRK